jgi:hypothetical protein
MDMYKIFMTHNNTYQKFLYYSIYSTMQTNSEGI